MPTIEILTSEALGERRMQTLHAWVEHAFEGDFEFEDWAHALGGVHVLVSDGRDIISHGALVPRRVEYGGHMLRAGYVEAVATRRDRRRQGHASAVMKQLGEIIQHDFDIGLLSTGLHEVYEPLGWQRWKGASYVQTPRGRERTAEDDDSLMALSTPRMPELDLNADLAADWRDGDVW